MKINRTSTALATLATILLAATAPAGAQTSTVNLSYTWSPPSTGSAVHHYIVQHSVNGGPFTTVASLVSSNSYDLEATIGDEHAIRVAAVDAQNRIGPYSPSSDPFTAAIGPPGQPGQPVLF
ncbi:MAG: hypothetical protein R6X25_12215 [Candidatus Krumholzibacteriia bacterium]